MVWDHDTKRESKDSKRCHTTSPIQVGGTFDCSITVLLIPKRRTKLCNFLEYRDTKVVYRRYASLFFIAGCASDDNELITLEIVHRYVEQMDKYYGNVCELDIIFNFQKAYFILDELLLAGEMQESSKKNVLRCISQEDSLEDMEVSLLELSCSFASHSCSVASIVFTHAACNFAFSLTSTVPQSGRGRSHQDHVNSASNKTPIH